MTLYQLVLEFKQLVNTSHFLDQGYQGGRGTW